MRACLEDCDDRGRETPGHPPEQWGDPAALARVAWFDEEMLSGKHVDFFHKPQAPDRVREGGAMVLGGRAVLI